MLFLSISRRGSSALSACIKAEGFYIPFPKKFTLIIYCICFICTLLNCFCVKLNSSLKLIPVLLGLFMFMLFLIYIVSWRMEQNTNLARNLNIMFQCYGVDEVSKKLNEQTYLQDMDHVQIKYNCCGINSLSDWLETYDMIPTSCCHEPEKCTYDLIKSKLGCYHVVKDIVYHSWDGIIVILVVFIFMMLVVLTLNLFHEISSLNEPNNNPN